MSFTYIVSAFVTVWQELYSGRRQELEAAQERVKQELRARLEQDRKKLEQDLERNLQELDARLQD